jgi:hypothetical protein
MICWPASAFVRAEGLQRYAHADVLAEGRGTISVQGETNVEVRGRVLGPNFVTR